ncbi:HAMP domain-containing protein [Candidatus Amarolinea aalborgensis]|jgi:CHASE3 domain sensor protein|uniref:HAMP domain-containing protein n=1 Tax=Candidatus Amarolinea aalborgensis TaxID=2249329 RepID=UPI003BF9CB6E
MTDLPTTAPMAHVSESDASGDRENLAYRIGAPLLNRMAIGRKLSLGFGILVLLTILGAIWNYVSSTAAMAGINVADEVRVPTALTAIRAEANLLRVQADVRGYLALSSDEYLQDQQRDARALQNDLNELTVLSAQLSPEDQQRLKRVRELYDQLAADLPTLFELHDDQLEREPAYAIVATKGLRLGGQVLIDVGKLIDEQGRRAAIEFGDQTEGIAQLAEMARFQGSFSAMLSGLRGYTTTRNRSFRGEYEANRDLNQQAWDQLQAIRPRLNAKQRDLVDAIAANRTAFLLLPNDIFPILESDRWRQDLYLFRTDVLPRSIEMISLLDQLTTNQQNALRTDLHRGRQDLVQANRIVLAGGGVALLLGIALATIFRENIAGPVRRLTRVAERVRGGDLHAQARVRSRDEIGRLGETFNSMTTKLSQTLSQVRSEKKRADDLLHVVIPIGVSLASEKDFNHLLETMLVEAKTFCRADAGTLYLRTETNQLKPMIVRNDTLNFAMGGTSSVPVTLPTIPLYDAETNAPNHSNISSYVALEGRSVNISDVAAASKFDFSGPRVFEAQTGYRSHSLLTMPLKTADDHVLGVMQLINAKDAQTGAVTAFDEALQPLMESFSSLAVAALEAYVREQGLRQEIQQLRIEIDETRRQHEVSAIVDTDFFQALQSKARTMRKRMAPAE